MPSDAAKNTLGKYIQYYETLTGRSIRLIEKVAEPGMAFKNPFNDIIGIDDVEQVFQHIFTIVENPKFKIRDYAWAEMANADNGGEMAFLRWLFTYELRGKRYSIEGMSEIVFSKRGLVLSHTDHWDSSEQLYERIPLLGNMLSFIKSKISAGPVT